MNDFLEKLKGTGSSFLDTLKGTQENFLKSNPQAPQPMLGPRRLQPGMEKVYEGGIKAFNTALNPGSEVATPLLEKIGVGATPAAIAGFALDVAVPGPGEIKSLGKLSKAKKAKNLVNLKIDPEDRKIMEGFIDSDRLGTEFPARLEKDVQTIAEGLGINTNRPARVIADKFDEYLARATQAEQRLGKGIKLKVPADADDLTTSISKAKASGQSFEEWVNGQGLVYHGSPNKFDKFDYKFIGTQGSSEGRGFYFTDKKDIAKGYFREGGQLVEAKVDIKKPISLEKIEMSKPDLKKFIDEYDKRERKMFDGEGGGYLDNVGDIKYEGRDKVLNKAVDLEYNGSDNDVDIIHSIVNSSGGDNEFAYSVLRDTLGYDGILAKNPEWGKGQTIKVAFFPDQIKTRSQLKAEWDKIKTNK